MCGMGGVFGWDGGMMAVAVGCEICTASLYCVVGVGVEAALTFDDCWSGLHVIPVCHLAKCTKTPERRELFHTQRPEKGRHDKHYQGFNHSSQHGGTAGHYNSSSVWGSIAG